MAREGPALLSATPRHSIKANVSIAHIQLRELIVCPREPSIVNYIQDRSIIELDVSGVHRKLRLADCNFSPCNLTALPLPDTDTILYAAGGQEAEIHLSLHSRSKQIWRHERILPGSINNSVLLSIGHEGNPDPRIVVSNNDHCVRFYDIAARRRGQEVERLFECGTLKLDVPLNHSSVSPDGRALLTVGDSNEVHLHHVTGSSRLSFQRTAKLILPLLASPHPNSYQFASQCAPASFSTAFSRNGSKFAVACQDGMVVVWDVRSTKPLKVFETNKTRGRAESCSGIEQEEEASGWLFEDPWSWARGGAGASARAPGWGVRSVKFGGPPDGKEIMLFTEHVNLMHAVDAQTFETEETIRVPTPGRARPQAQSRSPSPARSHLRTSRRYSAEDIMTMGHDHDAYYETEHDTENDDERFEGVVVIPPLGSRSDEASVRRTIRRHGFRTRPVVRSAYSSYLMRAHEEREEGRDGWSDPADHAEMEVDELESDCVSSRGSSPVPFSSAPATTTPGLGLSGLSSTRPGVQRQGSFGPSRTSWRHSLSHSHTLTSIPGSSTSILSPRSPSRMYREYSRHGHLNSLYGYESRRDYRGLASSAAEPEADACEPRLDLAGICFDPSGKYVYAASTQGISEWVIRGAEKRWWNDAAWR
ncbi:hypothetical protein PUNSTDRAFT_133719 [Punctularia strigosozonata HHB-11173 SS5]|uniref:uncharacterized protein n=1 Tax=Punctularia strigosozonata (strain HHB-11173) TaxID=741275 RepID=UPI0004418292|nr:uncharacterized protein PUNSTDRAFT_133719 [Punctularia strigosozonata HHB-11173 SS5]EIN09948.1 hypothetical protein PUNSTDRAFT_133719 [Punctularia strigosozonata HHB-11173 SS5]